MPTEEQPKSVLESTKPGSKSTKTILSFLEVSQWWYSREHKAHICKF